MIKTPAEAAEDKSLFTDGTIPLSVPSLPRTVQSCKFGSEKFIGMQQEADFNTEDTDRLFLARFVSHKF